MVGLVFAAAIVSVPTFQSFLPCCSSVVVWTILLFFHILDICVVILKNIIQYCQGIVVLRAAARCCCCCHFGSSGLLLWRRIKIKLRRKSHKDGSGRMCFPREEDLIHRSWFLRNHKSRKVYVFVRGFGSHGRTSSAAP